MDLEPYTGMHWVYSPLKVPTRIFLHDRPLVLFRPGLATFNFILATFLLCFHLSSFLPSLF